MPIEVKVGKGIDPSEILGHDFLIPAISRDGDYYRLNNLHLPTDYEEKIESFKRLDLQSFCDSFNEYNYEGKLNGQVLFDEGTNIITEINLENLQHQSSRVCLDQSFIIHRTGYYRSENVSRLSTAIIYHSLLSDYLSSVGGARYAYIGGGSNGYTSYNLEVSKDISESQDQPVTSEYHQDNFYPRAVYISGQFSTNLNYIKYDDRGIIKLVQVDNDDCHYINSIFGYGAHNVDTPFQAATLHGIVAEFLNEIIIRQRQRSGSEEI